MAERLTDRTAKTETPDKVDLIHLVDVSDATENAAGSSRKQTVENFLKGRAFLFIQGCYTLKATGNESTTVLEIGDLVIYHHVAGLGTFIIATIKATIITIPTDLRDSAKAANWLDTSAAL